MSDAEEAPTKVNGDKTQLAGTGKKSGSNEEKANKAADKQAADLDNAVEKFKNISDRLGGADKAKVFFDLYGPQDLAPAKTEDRKSDDSDKASDRAKELAKEHKLDTTIQDRSKFELGLPVRPPGYGAAYMGHDWAIETIAGVDNPASLKPDAWKIIADSNKFFHGFVLHPTGVMTRARFPTFELRTSDPIPAYEVFDASSVTIKETNSELERSMAQNGFSSTAISFSASIGGYGVSAAASASKSKEHSEGSSQGDFGSRKEYLATYSFPRARVFLDEFNLQVSPICSSLISKIRDAALKVKNNIDNSQHPDRNDAVKNAVRLKDRFLKQFGHVFSTSFQLGGQLAASKSADSIAETKDEQKRDAMKLAAALSFEAKGFGVSAGVSAGGSKEENKSQQSHSSSSSNTSALAWSARGGNSLLCANPPEWANSVASFSTWRTIEVSWLPAGRPIADHQKQEEVRYIIDLIGLIEDNDHNQLYSDVPKLFNSIDQQSFQQISAVPAGTWTGKITLETLDGKRLVFKGDRIALAESSQTDNQVIFTVLDADIKRVGEADPRLDQLYSEHPLFLVTGHSYYRNPAIGSQISGLCVDSQGALKRENIVQPIACRWSFRKPDAMSDFKSKWKPNSTVFHSGDEVRLYCHSFGSGSYRTVDKPPYYAPPVKAELSDKSALHVVDVNSNVVANESGFFDEDWADIRFTRGDGESMKALMEEYDRGITDGALERKIDVYNTFFGLEDATNLTSIMSHLDGGTSDEAHTQYSTKRFQELFMKGLREAMSPYKITGNPEKEITFKVRFVS